MTLDELFNHGKEFAKFAFEEQGFLCPMWIIETADGEHFPVMVPLEGPEYKKVAADVLKDLLRDKKAVRYVSIAEAWTYETKKGDKLEDVLALGPASEHPDRKEVIHVTAEDKYHSRTGHFYILRPDAEKPQLSEFHRHPENTRMEGLFSHLLEGGESVN